MESSQQNVSDREVRAALVRQYVKLASLYAGSRHRSWRDRLDAAAEGEVLVEPGWMLRSIVGDDVDMFGLYRVYEDGRIERDRFLEHEARARFRRTQMHKETAGPVRSRSQV